MIKKILAAAVLLALSFPLFAELSLSDKEAISDSVQLIVVDINNGDIPSLVRRLSPNADPKFKEAFVSKFIGKRVGFAQDISKFVELPDGSVKAKGSFMAKGIGFDINGLWDYMTFEKVNGDWLLVDSDLTNKLDMRYIFKFILVIIAIVFAIVLPLLAFWVWMLVDVIRKPVNGKVTWIIFMSIFGIPISIVYFFVVYLKNRKSPTSTPAT
jgi:hypothetical protein